MHPTPPETVVATFTRRWVAGLLAVVIPIASFVSVGLLAAALWYGCTHPL